MKNILLEEFVQNILISGAKNFLITGEGPIALTARTSVAAIYENKGYLRFVQGYLYDEQIIKNGQL